jgi:N-acetylmuramoyl-L-alanine amidase CwlA
MIKQNLVSSSKYSLKCPHAMTPIGVCVHNTANDASAKNEISYMIGNANQTSFHFAVDDIEIWQGLPLDRNGWHAGDGNGDGNRKHIGIEICYSKSGGDRFTKAEEKAAQFIASILKERKWGITQVKKHQDFSGKYCPHRTLDMGWDRFINMIKKYLGENMSDEYGNMVWKSTQHDETAKYYAPERNPRQVPSEEIVNHIGGLKSRITTLEKDLGKFKAEVENKQEIISRLEADLLTARGDVKVWIDRLEEAAHAIEQLGKEKGSLVIEVEQLKQKIKTLESLPQGGITGDSTIKQFINWVMDLFRRN